MLETIAHFWHFVRTLGPPRDNPEPNPLAVPHLCWGWATLQSNICQNMGNQSEAN